MRFGGYFLFRSAVRTPVLTSLISLISLILLILLILLISHQRQNHLNEGFLSTSRSGDRLVRGQSAEMTSLIKRPTCQLTHVINNTPTITERRSLKLRRRNQQREFTSDGDAEGTAQPDGRRHVGFTKGPSADNKASKLRLLKRGKIHTGFGVIG